MAASEETCEGNPDFAIICSFITKFGSDCGVNLSISYLKELLEDTKNVSEDLTELLIHLLRRGRKRVTKEKWEKSLIKFCHEYSSVDAWELERFGYKKAKLSVKLELLKRLLELQFDSNVKFKTEVNKQDASSLRIPPIGRDVDGQVYWYQLDKDHNMRLYRQGAENETEWHLLCSTTDELKNVLDELQKNNSKKEESADGTVETKELSEDSKPKTETDNDDVKACSISETKPNTIIIKTERKDLIAVNVDSTKSEEDSKPSSLLPSEKPDKKETMVENEVKIEKDVTKCGVSVKIEASEQDNIVSMEVDECKVIKESVASKETNNDIEMIDCEEVKVENKEIERKSSQALKPFDKNLNLAENAPITSVPEKSNIVEPIQISEEKNNDFSKNLASTPSLISVDSNLIKLPIKESCPTISKKESAPNKLPSPSVESPSEPNFKGGKIKLYERWNNQKKQAAALALNLDQQTAACDLSSSSQKSNVPENLSVESRKSLLLKSTSKTHSPEPSSAREEFPMDLSISHRSTDTTNQTKINTPSSGSRIDFNSISNLSKSSVDCNGNKDRPSHITSSPVNFKALDSDIHVVSEAPRPLKKKHTSTMKDEHSNQNSEHLRKSVIFEVKNSKLNQYQENQTNRESIYTAKVSTGSSFSHLQALQNMCDTNRMMNVQNSVIHSKKTDKTLNYSNVSSKASLNTSEKSFNDNYCDNLSKRYNFNSAQVMEEVKSNVESTDSSMLLKSNVAQQNNQPLAESYKKCSSVDDSKTYSDSSAIVSCKDEIETTEDSSLDAKLRNTEPVASNTSLSVVNLNNVGSAESDKHSKTGHSFDKVIPDKHDSSNSSQEQKELKHQSKPSTKEEKLDERVPLNKVALIADEAKTSEAKEYCKVIENSTKVSPLKTVTSSEEETSRVDSSAEKIDAPLSSSEKFDPSSEKNPPKAPKKEVPFKDLKTVASEVLSEKHTDKKRPEASNDKESLTPSNAEKSLESCVNEESKQTPDNHMQTANYQDLKKEENVKKQEPKAPLEKSENEIELKVPGEEVKILIENQPEKDKTILEKDSPHSKLSKDKVGSICEIKKCVLVSEESKNVTSDASKTSKVDNSSSKSPITLSNKKHQKIESVPTSFEDEKKASNKTILQEDVIHSISDSKIISGETSSKTSSIPSLQSKDQSKISLMEKSVTELRQTDDEKIETSDSCSEKKSLDLTVPDIPDHTDKSIDSENIKSVKKNLESTEIKIISKSEDISNIEGEIKCHAENLGKTKNKEVTVENESLKDEVTQKISLCTEKSISKNKEAEDNKNNVQSESKSAVKTNIEISNLETVTDQSCQKQILPELPTVDPQEINNVTEDIEIKESDQLCIGVKEVMSEEKDVQESSNETEIVKCTKSEPPANEPPAQKEAEISNKNMDQPCKKPVVESNEKKLEEDDKKLELVSVLLPEPSTVESLEASVPKVQNEEEINEKDSDDGKETKADMQPKAAKQFRGIKKKRVFTPRKNRRKSNLKSSAKEANTEAMDVIKNSNVEALHEEDAAVNDKKANALNSDDSSESELNLMALMKKTNEKKGLSKDEKSSACDENGSNLEKKLDLPFDLHCIKNTLCLETKVKRVSFNKVPVVVSPERVISSSKPLLLTTFSMDTTDDIEIIEEKININTLKKKKGRLRAPLSKTTPAKVTSQSKKVPLQKPSSRKKTPKGTQFSSGDGEKKEFSIPEGFLEILSNADKQTSKPAKVPRARSRIEDLATTPSQQSSDGESSTPIKRSRRIQEQHKKKSLN